MSTTDSSRLRQNTVMLHRQRGQSGAASQKMFWVSLDPTLLNLLTFTHFRVWEAGQTRGAERSNEVNSVTSHNLPNPRKSVNGKLKYKI